MKGAIVGPDGATCGLLRRPTPHDRGPDAVVDAVGATLGMLLEDGRRRGIEAAAAGVVVPGIVDEERGVAVFSANLGWRDLPLRALLAARTGAPVAGAAAVAARVREGDPDAEAVWADAVAALAHALAAAVAVLAPRLVVVGGGLAGAGDLLLRPLSESLLARLPPRAARVPRLVLAALGDQAGCLGAALLARRALDAGAPP